MVTETEEEIEPGEDWFRDLQRQVRAKGVRPNKFLPVLGCEGYIRKGRSHLLAAYAKVGKTELMVNILLGWETQKVLYVSEEDRGTWEDRAEELPDWPNEMLLVYALGMEPQAILGRVAEWDGSIVIIDTIKLLGIEDENDAAKVQAGLSPFVAQCRKNRQTLIFLHHDNKHGGKGGRGVSGSHAFVAIVDIFLEIDEVVGHPNQRVLSGRGKIRNISGLTYERRTEDGLMRALDSSLMTARLTVQKWVGANWQTTAEIAELAGYSPETALKHLKDAAKQGQIERDPAMGEDAKGRTVRWRSERDNQPGA